MDVELREFANNTFFSITIDELATPDKEGSFAILALSKTKCLPTFGKTLKSGSKETLTKTSIFYS